MPAGRPSEHGDQRLGFDGGHLADREDAALPQLDGGLLPDAPQPLDRQGMEEVELGVGGHYEQPVRFADPAGDLSQELGPRDTYRDGQADLVVHSGA